MLGPAGRSSPGIPEMIHEVSGRKGRSRMAPSSVTIHHRSRLSGDLELRSTARSPGFRDLSVFEGSKKDSQISPGSTTPCRRKITLNRIVLLSPLAKSTISAPATNSGGQTLPTSSRPILPQLRPRPQLGKNLLDIPGRRGRPFEPGWWR